MATTAPAPAQAPPPPTAAPPKPHEGYVAGGRPSAGGVVARISAVGLLLGLLGGLTALADTTSGTSVFDMARNEGPLLTEVKLPPLGFLIGPVLILLLLPVARGRNPRVYPKRSYRPRVALASLLWVAGLVAFGAEVASLEARFTIASGTYIAGALLVLGLLATLAMWPAGLASVPLPARGRGGAASPPIASPPIAPQPAAAAAPRGPFRIALAVLAAVGVLVAVLYLAVFRPDIEQKNDAKAALGAATAQIGRSYPLSRAATRDTMRAANSPAMAASVIDRLDGVVVLRRRAIRTLAPIGPLPLGDDRYDAAAAHWTAELRGSIRVARDLQFVLQEVRSAGVTPFAAVSTARIRNARDALVTADARLRATRRSRIEPLR